MTLRARDVMQTEVLAVPPSLSVIELADFLIRERISGVPVVADGELIGHVSRSDLVRAGSLERSLAGLAAEAVDAPEFAPASEPTLVASLATLAPELQARSVRDIMVTEVVTVTPETPIAEVARLLLARHLHRVVVSDGRQVRGVISALDLVRLIADERLRPG
jgi:CBS domain-containing protein